MLRVPSIKELTYKCKQCGFTNIKRKSISANPEAWGVSRGITQTGSYSLATPTPDTFDYEVLSDGQPNHLLNSELETWTAGAAAAPDNWVYASTGAPSVARETNPVHDGLYSASVICLGGAENYAYLYQYFYTALGMSYWRGKTVTVGGWVYCLAADTAELVIVDDIISTTSGWHPGPKFDGDGNAYDMWQWMTATRTIPEAVNTISVCLYVKWHAIVHNAYFDNIRLIEGTSFEHNNISFTAATGSTPAKINDAACRFADLGFVPGDTIIIKTTSGTNDGTYTLATRGGITNGSLSLSSADSLTTESANAAGTVTLSIRTYKPNITTGCSFCGSLNSR